MKLKGCQLQRREWGCETAVYRRVTVGATLAGVFIAYSTPSHCTVLEVCRERGQEITLYSNNSHLRYLKFSSTLGHGY